VGEKVATPENNLSPGYAFAMVTQTEQRALESAVGGFDRYKSGGQPAFGISSLVATGAQTPPCSSR